MTPPRCFGFALIAALLPALASAQPPPPDQRDVQVRDALGQLGFLVGSWRGRETSWPNVDFTLNADDKFGAIYIQTGDRQDNVCTLGFDITQGKYLLFCPKVGGVELVQVSMPAPGQIVYVTHPDGPAIRTTITSRGSGLHLEKALLDVDGVVKPEVEVDLERLPAKQLMFMAR